MVNKINIVFVGHVDHGKSTMIGRMLYDSESITETRVSEIQKIAEEYKKRFEFAYFIDSFDDELKEERTIDTTRVIFKSKKNLYTIIDVPGHKEFLKHMLSGASHADAGVLVISAFDGIQEQTGRHVYLLNLLGIKNLLVAVNKMDEVGFSEEKFLDIKKRAEKILNENGYRNITFIPVSAMEGDNIFKTSQNMDWFRGFSLVEELDRLKIASNGKSKLRFVVQDTYDDKNAKIVVGRVESGMIEKSQEVIFMPSGTKEVVKKIKTYDADLKHAHSGDCAGLVMDTIISRGEVCGEISDPPAVKTSFTGEAILLEDGIKKGDMLEIRCGTKKVNAKITDIADRIDSETGKVISRGYDEIKANEAARIRFKTEPIVVEKFADIPSLGRFTLIKNNKNIGAGIIMEF